MTPDEIKMLELDTALAVQINQQGTYEIAEREAQQATILRNVRRWQLARVVKEQKRLRRENYLLRNCRATIGDIIANHKRS